MRPRGRRHPLVVGVVSVPSVGPTVQRRARAVVAALSGVAVGAALTWLLWAAVLGVWSWRGAGPSPAAGALAYSRPDQLRQVAWARYSPQHIAVELAITAALLLAAMVLTWWRVRYESGWLVLAVCAGVVWVLLWVHGQGRQVLYHLVNDAYPVTARLPTAAAAWDMALWGAAAVIVAGPALSWPVPARRWWAGAGVVLAVVSATLSTAAAVRAGDDRRFVDASTAVPIPIPGAPARLGRHAFTIRVTGPISAAASGRRDWRVEAAGAGFITLAEGTVSAYDPNGGPRWHYRRLGPRGLQADSLRVFDDGRTVVVGLGPSQPLVVVGLDALSGQQLWWSSEQRLLEAFGRADPSPDYLIHVSDGPEQWTRFNTRSGRPMWTKPLPTMQCSGPRYGWPTLPAAATRCASDRWPLVRLSEFDPATGDAGWSTTLLAGAAIPAVGESALLPRAYRAGSGGALVDTGVRPFGAPDNGYFATYVNLSTHLVRNLTPAVSESPVWVAHTHPGPTTSEDFLAYSSQTATGMDLYGPDGQTRCSLPGEHRFVVVRREDLALVLGDQIVIGATEHRGDDHAQALTTYRRSDCTPLAAVPTPGDIDSLVAAPGVVLAVRTDTTGTYVDGYRD